MTKNWEHLPNELKQFVVGKLDYTSRCSLRVTSKAHMELIDATPINLNRVMLYISANPRSPIHLCTAHARRVGDTTDDMPLLPLLRLLSNPKSSVQKFMLIRHEMHPQEVLKKILDKLKEMNFSMRAATIEWVGSPGQVFFQFLEHVNVDYCKTLNFDHDGTDGIFFVRHREMFDRFDTIRIKCNWKPLDAYMYSRSYHFRPAPRPIGSFLHQIPSRPIVITNIRRLTNTDDLSRFPRHEDRGLVFHCIDYFGISLVTWVCPIDWKWKAFEEHLLRVIFSQPFFDEGIGGALGSSRTCLTTSLAKERQLVRLERFSRRKTPNGRMARKMHLKRLLSVHI